VHGQVNEALAQSKVVLQAQLEQAHAQQQESLSLTKAGVSAATTANIWDLWCAFVIDFGCAAACHLVSWVECCNN